jgi:hypothetical protein
MKLSLIGCEPRLASGDASSAASSFGSTALDPIFAAARVAREVRQ